MAYFGHDTRPKASSTPGARRTPPLAWGRLLGIAVSLVAWVGIIAAIKAVL
jgi:hypothetical protein